ncbi:hypothetical protein [Neorhodopirellula lusitana]|nr:hypothetical protein [Neorhodopirellula lusitana]
MPACLAGIREARRRDSTDEQAVQRLNRPNFKPVEGTPGSHGNFRGDLDLKLGGAGRLVCCAGRLRGAGPLGQADYLEQAELKGTG